MSKVCQKCKEESEDLRTLWMSCFYDMDELDMPFDCETLFESSDPRDDGFLFYTLKVCKDCRADWMQVIKTWWRMPPYKHVNNPGTGIFVRELGATVEITEEEFYKRQQEREGSTNEKSS